MQSPLITKEEAIELIGCKAMPCAGYERLRLLRKEGLLTKPVQSSRLYFRAEIEKVLPRFGSDIFFKQTKGKYELIITSIKAA